MDINQTVLKLNQNCRNKRSDGISWQVDDFSYEDRPRKYCKKYLDYPNTVYELCDNCEGTIKQFDNIARLQKIDLKRLALDVQKIMTDIQLIKSVLRLNDV